MQVEQAQDNLGAPIEDENVIEERLSERLLQGFVLLEKNCPVCATPLVKNQPKHSDDDAYEPTREPMMVSSASFEQPFNPVDGVPFCVACSSHVVTQESEVQLIQHSNTLKRKGSIVVALQSAGTTDSPVDVKEEDGLRAARSNEFVVSSPRKQSVIDVTDMKGFEPQTHADEKKEDEGNQGDDEVMVEYSVR